jgi:bifunctional non-homologous end joining protein LigD
MPSRLRALPAGFIVPCLPTRAPHPPYDAIWLHEIKHNGFRVIARKVGKRVRLYSRPGNDLTHRFPGIVEALAQLRPWSCIIDGEAVLCGDDGIASFDRIRYRRHDADVFMWAFDLVELNGDDLRRDPLAVRKARLLRLLARAAPGIQFNEHLDEEDGPRASSGSKASYRNGATQFTVLAARRTGSNRRTPRQPAVRREAEEDWSGRRQPKRLLIRERV